MGEREFRLPTTGHSHHRPSHSQFLSRNPKCHPRPKIKEIKICTEFCWQLSEMLFLLKINIGLKCRHSLNFTIVTNGKNLEFLMKRTAIYSANLAIIHLLSPVFFLLSDEARSLNKNLRVQTFKGIRCSLSFPDNLYGWWENFTSFAFS